MRSVKMNHRVLTILLATLALNFGAFAQKLIDKSLPPNDPKNDPYTLGDPDVMKGAGILSHGGFDFGETNTEDVEKFMSTSDIRWLETEHFQIGFALGSYKLNPKEKKAMRLELTRLAKRLPSVNPKAKILDPWLRTHLFAMRLEDMYADFLKLVQLEQSVFPDGSKPWNRTGIYRGEGPHLGMRDKYELMILPSKAAHLAFMNKHFGLTSPRTQRWNVVHRESLTLTLHTQQGSLKVDECLHGHIAFSMGINFLNGLEHYTYDIPIWLREGIGHWAERRVTQKFNTFDGAEGSIPETSRESDWSGAAKKAISQEKAPRIASLMAMRGFGDLVLTDHFSVWSMIDFLHTAHPKEFAMFIQALKGRTNEDGFSDLSDVPAYHRSIFKEHLGMSYSAFDTAWREWALVNY
ncbi:MAG: hypothetical protein ACI8X5_001580 [Planctomycetota bacterium]|jgi:hypothetical protein